MKKNLFSTRIMFAMGCIAVAGLLFSACNKFDNEDNNTPVAGLMAFNLTPDKTVGVAISGNSLTNAPLSYTNYTGGYVAIYPGNRSVEFFNHNSDSSLASTSFNFVQEKYYSSFLVGANGNYRNVIVQDNFDSLSVATGQAYIRYINAIPDSSNPAVTITANGSHVSNDNAAFAFVSDFKAVNPGDVSITVNNGSSINANRTITLEQKKTYTILLSGIPGSGSNSVQIKYIVNGTLEDEAAQRISSSAQSVRIN